MAEPPLPHPQSLWYSGWESSPHPSPPHPWEHTGAWRSWGRFRKTPCQECITQSGPTKENIGPVERGQTDPQAGRLEEQAPQESGVRHQVKYDLQSIHRHFLYKHPSPDRKQGWGNWRVGGPPGPPRGRQMDRKSGEEEVSGEKQWGEGGEKKRMLGRSNRPHSPLTQAEASLCFSFPEKCILTRQMGKLRL